MPAASSSPLPFDSMPLASRSATGPAETRAPKRPAATPAARARRDKRETAAGCRERASADLLKSVPMLIANERARMESSAASWTARAELLERLEASFAARQARGGSFDPDPDEPGA